MGELKRVQVYDHTSGGYVDIHDPLKCEDCIRYGSIGDHYDADAVDAEITRLRAIEAAAREVVAHEFVSEHEWTGGLNAHKSKSYDLLTALRAALGRENAGMVCECCHGTRVGPSNSNFAGQPCPVCS